MNGEADTLRAELSEERIAVDPKPIRSQADLEEMPGVDPVLLVPGRWKLELLDLRESVSQLGGDGFSFLPEALGPRQLVDADGGCDIGAFEATDTDGDGFDDGNEVDNNANPLVVNSTITDNSFPALSQAIGQPEFVTASSVKFVVRTTERTKLEVTVPSVNGSPQVVQAFPDFDDVHTIIVDRLAPSVAGIRTQLYSGSQLRMEDLNGNVTTVGLPSFQTEDATDPGAVVDQIALSNENRTGNVYTADLSISATNPTAAILSPPPPFFGVVQPIFEIPVGPTSTQIASGGVAPGFVYGFQVVRETAAGRSLVPLSEITVTSGGFATPDFAVLQPLVGYLLPTYGALPGPWILTDNVLAGGSANVSVSIANSPAGETLHFVPKIMAERYADTSLYNFQANPFLFNSNFSALPDQSAIPPGTAPPGGVLPNRGTHQFLHLNLVRTEKTKRIVSSSI